MVNTSQKQILNYLSKKLVIKQPKELSSDHANNARNNKRSFPSSPLKNIISENSPKASKHIKEREHYRNLIDQIDKQRAILAGATVSGSVNIGPYINAS